MFRSPIAEVAHAEQYTETGGNRAYQTTAWKIVTNHQPGTPFDDAEWRLYDLPADPTETRDLAAERPEVLAELAAAWEQAAWKNRVFPLDDHGPASALRRPDDDHLSESVTLLPGTPTLERYRSAQLIAHRDFAVSIAAGSARRRRRAGGPRRPGRRLSDPVEPDAAARRRPRRTERLRADASQHPDQAGTPGHLDLVLQVTARPGFRWDVVLTDGVAVAALDDVPQLLGMAPFTGISVGADRGGPVDWDLHLRHGSLPYSGVLHHVRYHPGPLSPDAPAERARVWAEGATIYD